MAASPDAPENHATVDDPTDTRSDHRSGHDQGADSRDADESAPVVAQLVGQPTVPIDGLPPDFQNIAANGGAIGAVILGAWAIVGGLVTPFSLINAGLAVLLGIWGLWSPRRKLAITGIVLAMAATVICVADIRGMIDALLATETDLDS